MPNSGLNTITILDRLVDLRLIGEAEFQRMHHLHDSVAGFRSYCSKVKSFHRNGNNRKLHDWLQAKLDAFEWRGK